MFEKRVLTLEQEVRNSHSPFFLIAITIRLQHSRDRESHSLPLEGWKSLAYLYVNEQRLVSRMSPRLVQNLYYKYEHLSRLEKQNPPLDAASVSYTNLHILGALVVEKDRELLKPTDGPSKRHRRSPIVCTILA